MHPTSINSRPALGDGHNDQQLTHKQNRLPVSQSAGPPPTNSQPLRTVKSISLYQQKITATDVVVIGNGPAGLIMSLLLSGYVPYFHSDESTPHPDPILQGALAASDLAGEHPRSLLDQDLPALASHIQHQLAETGRDANPVGAMLDSLAHPNIDTQRGEHPSYLAWTTPHNDNFEHSARSGRRPHVVLGRGDIGGIWADMDHDHTQTLSYSESMELPIYSLAQFLKEHPDEYDVTLERPKRATVSAYYKSYAERMNIRDNFWTYTTVTDVFHLKDLENHCCCYLDPDLTQQDHDSRPGDDADEWSDYSGQYQCQKCLPYRYAILGYRQLAPFANVEGDRSQKKNSRKRRQHFLLRCKTLALATGTFDQPRKIQMSTFQSKPKSENTIPAPTPAASAHSTPPSTIPLFYDTRSIDEWMAEASSPVSSAAGTCDTSLPIVIVGTGLSAADAILLVRERQPHRPIIHLYRYATASEPSPLKRCHKEVYPEYASIWTLMKKCATRLGRAETSLASSLSPAPGSYYKSCYEYSNTKPKEPCNCQQAAVDETMLGTISPQPTPPPCHGCVYTGLADATLSGWDPLNGQVEIILNSGLRVQRRVAAIGVFIGKQVNMGFLKGSLALDYLQAPSDSALLNIPSTAPYRNKLTLATMSTPSRRQPEKPLALDTQVHMLPQLRKQESLDTAPDIPTPPSTPPFLPIEGEVLVNQDDNTDTVDPQIRDENLTALKPIVTDMWTLRLVPAPRAARPLRPSLAQRAFTPHLASTSVSTPTSPALLAVHSHNVAVSTPPPFSPLEPTVGPTLNPRKLQPDTSPYHNSVFPSSAEESPTTDSLGNGHPCCVRTSTEGATNDRCQPSACILAQQERVGWLGQCCPQGTQSTSDLRSRSNANRKDATSLHLHLRQPKISQEHSMQRVWHLPQSGLPSPPCCFSMPCSPVLSCADRVTTGRNKDDQRRRTGLLSIPSFFSLGQRSIDPTPSLIQPAQVRATVAKAAGPTPRNALAAKECAKDEAKKEEERENNRRLVSAKPSVDFSDHASSNNDVLIESGNDEEFDDSSSCRCSSNCSCGTSTESSDTTILSPSLPPLPRETALQFPSHPLMDQSIYAVGAVTGSKFVRFILGHCIASVSDMINSDVVIPTACD